MNTFTEVRADPFAPKPSKMLKIRKTTTTISIFGVLRPVHFPRIFLLATRTRHKNLTIQRFWHRIKDNTLTATMIWPKMGITLGLSLLLALSLSSDSVLAKPLLNNDAASPFKIAFKYSFFHRAASASMVSAVAAQQLSEGATDTLTVSIPLSQSPALHEGRDGPLMRDINMLTDILGDLVEQENPKVHALYEEFLALGVER